MDFQEEYLKAAHKASFANKESILTSKQCGCFYCQQRYIADSVEEWAEDDQPHPTALCPKCGVDAVLGDATEYPVTDEVFLIAMNQQYFKMLR